MSFEVCEESEESGRKCIMTTQIVYTCATLIVWPLGRYVVLKLCTVVKRIFKGPE